MRTEDALDGKRTSVLPRYRRESLSSEGIRRELSGVVGAGIALVMGFVLAAAVAGCGGSTGEHAGPSTSDSSLAGPPGAPASGGPFVENGPLTGGGEGRGDASQVASLIAAPIEGAEATERLVVGFARPDGMPATTIGPVRARFMRAQRVVRILLPDEITSTAITENRFASPLANAAYVVRSLDDARLFIDLHLRAPALARGVTYAQPALESIELKPGGESLPSWPSEQSNVVVLTPARDARVRYPIEISGYARTFEANVVAELRRDGKIVVQTHTTAADYISAWGEFRMRFDDGPKGKFELFVGDYSAKDGTPQGVRMDLQID